MLKSNFPIYNPLLFPHLNKALKKLVFWYQENHRALPFREKPTPYTTFISEMMLQQTTMKTVIDYYLRFIQTFPTIKQLAESNLEKVLELWSGLGYYSRAKNMHAAAKIIFDKYGGIFPSNIQELLELPGIGNYTAGAILSLGYNLPAPIVDTNIIRVLSRFHLIRSPKSPYKREWRLTFLLVNYAKMLHFSPREFNQSLMELGALICTPKNPQCLICPLHSICKVYVLQLSIADYPILSLKPQKQEITEKSLLFIKKEKNDILILIEKNPQKKWLKELWDIPFANKITHHFIPDSLPLFSLNYTITHHKIKRYVYLAIAQNDFESIDFLELNFKWISLEELVKPDKIAASSILKKIAKKVKNLENSIFSNSLYT